MIKTIELFKIIKKQSDYFPKAKNKYIYFLKKYGVYALALIPILYLYSMVLLPLYFNQDNVALIKVAVMFVPQLLFGFFSIGAVFVFIVVFLSCFGYFYQTFFQDKAIENYLAFPISNSVLIKSKLLFVLINCLIFGYLVFVPFFLIVLKYADFNLMQCLLLFLVPLQAVFIAFTISSIFTLFIVWLASKFKNKQVAQALYYFVLIAFGIVAYLVFIGASSSLNSIDFDDVMKSVPKLLVSLNNNIYLDSFNKVTALYFNPIKAIFEANYLTYFLYFIIFPVILYGVLFVYSRNYLRFYLGFNEITSKSKKFSSTTFKKLKKTSLFMSFYSRELKEVLRTGPYFFNGVFSTILVVFIYSGMVCFTIISAKIRISSDFNMLILVGLQLYLIFMGSLSMLPATVVSREGENIYFLKSLPISYFKAFSAKLFVIYVFNAFIICVSVLVPLFLARASFVLILGALFIILTFIPLSLFAGGVIDTLFTNLKWVSSTALMKRSKNNFFAMIFEWAFLAGLIFVNYLIVKANVDFGVLFAMDSFDFSYVSNVLNILFFVNFVVVFLLTGLFIFLFKKLLFKRFKNIE